MKMLDELITVIVPVYNVELYLEQCLYSLSQQTYKNIEVIMIDDGSKDNSGQICNKWKEKDNRFNVVHIHNKGLSNARNIGIEMSTGEWLMFVDSDDFVSNTFCEDAINIVHSSKAEIGVFNLVYYWDDYEKIESNQYLDSLVDSKIVLEKLIDGVIDNYVVNKIYRKSLFKDVKFPVGCLWEDIGTTYKLILQTDKIAFSKQYNYYYRQNRLGSIVMSKPRSGNIDLYKHYCEQYKICTKIYPEFGEKIYRKVKAYAFFVALRYNTDFFELEQFQEIDAILKKESVFSYPISHPKKILLLIYKISPKLFGVIVKMAYKKRGSSLRCGVKYPESTEK